MVETNSLMNGFRATADDVEKGEVDVEKGEVSSDSEHDDLEEGEVSDMEEADSEKRGEVYETELPGLLEPLLTPEEAHHEELAAGSKPLILTEKVGVSLFVVCFVLVQAYFVGRSFRNWINNNEHFHDGNSMSRKEFGPIGSSVEFPLVVPIDGGGGGGGKESIATPEPFEDFLEGSLNSGVGTARKGLFDSVLAKKMSSVGDQSSPILDINPQLPNSWVTN